MEPIITTCYCIRAVASIGKLALDYRKVQNLNDTNLKLHSIQILNESIKDYLGLIHQDVQSLMHMYFKSAYENLDFALNASPDCKKDYLIQARNKFIDACVIEKNGNLILSYLGLSLCQNLLGDSSNSIITLNRIKAVNWTDIYSNNTDDVLKDWDSIWFRILLKIQIACIGYHLSPYSSNKPKAHDIIDNEIDNELSWLCGKDPTIDDRKYVYHRRLDAIKRSGGFSLNEKEFLNTCVNAEKLILKEDFSRLKEEVINTFHL